MNIEGTPKELEDLRMGLVIALTALDTPPQEELEQFATRLLKRVAEDLRLGLEEAETISVTVQREF